MPAKCTRASCFMRATCASSRCFASVSITGPIWVAMIAGVADREFARGAGIISIMRSATSS